MNGLFLDLLKASLSKVLQGELTFSGVGLQWVCTARISEGSLKVGDEAKRAECSKHRYRDLHSSRKTRFGEMYYSFSNRSHCFLLFPQEIQPNLFWRNLFHLEALFHWNFMEEKRTHCPSIWNQPTQIACLFQQTNEFPDTWLSKY